MSKKRISLGYRPRGCRLVRIIGVKPNLSDYGPEERELLNRAEAVLYPTRYYAQALEDAGKKTFPSARHYYYLGDKIKQTTLFHLLGIAHPRTRLFFGRRAREVFNYFSFPFIAKIPRGIGRGLGVYIIKNEDDWREYLSRTHTAYVQEYLELDRDLRVVVVAGRLLTAYWRLHPPDNFRSNLYQGGIISFTDLPEDGVAFALDAARRCGFDDVGLDVCRFGGRWMILEANMHYGYQGLLAAGVSLPWFLEKLIREKVI